ncbi:SH3 domain-containing protein 3-like isoform X1 [Impatiens glandulifera]|uniref:SH3 domain-containing protein 3-like isoform X1 n=2 Tax=Impatiens glandulifera TaxID=253017 RepID=UPI001FB05CCC|nr:SH3 domain-containing protein 3-like isoform X1 [Impatiens glandulifera]
MIDQLFSLDQINHLSISIYMFVFAVVSSRRNRTGTVTMEAFKRQASKLREQVAKQQQALMRQLGRLGEEPDLVDEFEDEYHQRLLKLHNSTTTAKHFQKDIVRGLEGYISIGKKQMEIAKRLAEDCCRHGIENQNSVSALARAAQQFGISHKEMESERQTMLGVLGDQVCEPLRKLIAGAPLEDARHLAYRYEKLCQEMEAQASEVLRRRSKYGDPSAPAEYAIKLQNSENKLNELKSSVKALGKEAITAMLSVEDHQQTVTSQKLKTMVDAEKSYHLNIIAALDNLHAKMMLENQQNVTEKQGLHVSVSLNGGGGTHKDNLDHDNYFVAKVLHGFDTQTAGELSLSKEDYVVVRQVAPTGWSEGECNGRVGWFPSAYVERIDNAQEVTVMKENT